MKAASASFKALLEFIDWYFLLKTHQDYYYYGLQLYFISFVFTQIIEGKKETKKTQFFLILDQILICHIWWFCSDFDEKSDFEGPNLLTQNSKLWIFMHYTNFCFTIDFFLKPDQYERSISKHGCIRDVTWSRCSPEQQELKCFLARVYLLPVESTSYYWSVGNKNNDLLISSTDISCVCGDGVVNTLF